MLLAVGTLLASSSQLKMATNTMTACSHCKAQCEAASGSQQVESGFGQFAEEMLGRHIQCELSQSHKGKLSHFKYMMGVEKCENIMHR